MPREHMLVVDVRLVLPQELDPVFLETGGQAAAWAQSICYFGSICEDLIDASSKKETSDTPISSCSYPRRSAFPSASDRRAQRSAGHRVAGRRATRARPHHRRPSSRPVAKLALGGRVRSAGVSAFVDGPPRWSTRARPAREQGLGLLRSAPPRPSDAAGRFRHLLRPSPLRTPPLSEPTANTPAELH